jgi:cell wall-associated NlpC family hydrolase
MHPKPGDLLLFHNARGMNRIITGFTGSPFYHVALYVSQERAIEATLTGVGYRNLRGEGNSYVVVPAPKGNGRAAVAWAETQIGASYAGLDLVVIALDKFFRFIHFNYTPPGKYSCGEFVETAYEQAGARLILDRDLDDVVPGDFARFVPAAERKQIH